MDVGGMLATVRRKAQEVRDLRQERLAEMGLRLPLSIHAGTKVLLKTLCKGMESISNNQNANIGRWSLTIRCPLAECIAADGSMISYLQRRPLKLLDENNEETGPFCPTTLLRSRASRFTAKLLRYLDLRFTKDELQRCHSRVFESGQSSLYTETPSRAPS